METKFLLEWTFISECEIPNDVNDLLISVSNKKILKVFIDSTIPILLKCLKIEYEIDFNECFKYIDRIIDLTVAMECKEMTAEIMKVVCEWSVYNNFINCKPNNIIQNMPICNLKLH